MTSKSSQQIARVLVPNFDSAILRTTSKQVIRIEYNRPNLIAMATKSSQQITSVLVPKFYSRIIRATGEQTITKTRSSSFIYL
jgi:hypothetical protein